jgi:hypothetical protein
MAHVEVTGGTIEGGQITALHVRMYGLAPRTITRDQAISWLKDGHSLVPVGPGGVGRALLLVEVPGDDGDTWFIRTSPDVEPADSLPF